MPTVDQPGEAVVAYARASTTKAILGIAASLVVPGVGHLIVGRRRRAMGFFIGDAVIVVATLWVLSLGSIGLLQLLVQPTWVRAIVVGNVALGLFRLAAAVDLAISERPVLDRLPGVLVVGALGFVLLAPHLFVATRAASLLGVLETVFPAEGQVAIAIQTRRDALAAERAAAAQGPVTTATSTTSAAAIPGVADGTVIPDFDDVGDPQLESIDLNRITVLLAGGDAGPGRGGLRTDTMILASLDVETGDGVLISLSRELVDFPLPPKLRDLESITARQELLFAAAQAAQAGGFSQSTDPVPDERDESLWLDRINAIYPFTNSLSGMYPNDARPGMAALRDTISYALGIHIDYYVLVDFAGFVDLVDALGGVTITSRETMNIRMSPAKAGEEDTVLNITPGRHHLDGRSALVYVRNRTDTSDVVRTRRQRCFVREVVGQVAPSTIISRFDGIARAISRYARTDIPLGVLPDLIQVVADLEKADIATMAIEPGELANKSNYRGLPVLNVDRARAAVDDILAGLHEGEPVAEGNECPS